MVSASRLLYRLMQQCLCGLSVHVASVFMWPQCLCGLCVHVVSVVYVSFDLRFDASASSIMLPREVEMMLD